MLVSIIIPVFNREQTIRRTLNSALNQTYKNTEVIVVDDGSTDATADILNDYSPRIRVITQPNAGVSAARNSGTRVARGELIAFLDSDDEWLPIKIENQVRLLSDAPDNVACCISNTRFRENTFSRKTSFDLARLKPSLNEGLWLNPLEVLLTRFLLFNQAAMVRRSALEEAGGYNEGLRILEDWDLAIRLARYPWAFITEPHVVYNSTPGSLSRSVNEAAICNSSFEVLSRLIEGNHVSSTDKFVRMKQRTLRRTILAQKLRGDPSPLKSFIGAAGLRLLRAQRTAGYWFGFLPGMKVSALPVH